MNTRSTARSASPQEQAPGSQIGKIVIVGGGIVGASTAYFLSELGAGPNTTIIERCGIACAASGKAGGFLALDWSDGTKLSPLARASYKLHAELAQKFGRERIDYRPVHTMMVAGTEAPPAKKPRIPIPPWLDGHVTAADYLGDPQTTAQVHPYKLTTTLMEHAKQQGAQLVEGVVSGLDIADGKVTGVRVNGQTIPADIVVLAMGPWTDEAARQWGLKLPRVQGLKSHSLIYKPKLPESERERAPGDQCLFTSFEYKSGKEAEPEIYPRPDGTVYVCGEGSEPEFLEGGPERVAVEDKRCANLVKAASNFSSTLKEEDITDRQACNLPIGPDGAPIIGAVPGVNGAYVATGHSCWGILNGPATGKSLAEQLVLGSSKTVDLKPYSPARFARFLKL